MSNQPQWGGKPVDGEPQRADGSGTSMFSKPPERFTDECGRTIDIREYNGGHEALVRLYEMIEPDDRTQGLPPVTTDRIKLWLDEILQEGLHIVAWHDDQAVGHACLLPAGNLGHELAIFVRSSYQRARIGTRLLRTLLGAGNESDVDRVWLTVRRNNFIARRLYESAGFRYVDSGSAASAADVEMVRQL